jgi:hypothetical protein
MEKNIISVAMVGMLMVMPSCIKTNGATGTSAFNIVNAINNSNPIVTNFTPLNGKELPMEPLQFYSSANSISWGSSSEASYIGNTYLSVSQISDTTTALWTGEFELVNGSIHTLFFYGDTTSVDTLYTTDVVPYYTPLDSVAGIRFVNLVLNSQPMSVNLQGNRPSQFEFNNLSFKSVSAFKAYSANSNAPNVYTFEIRNQANDSLLTTYYWGWTFERNNTIYISGSNVIGISAFQMNNY